MSADTMTAGYPAHRVIAFCRWRNEHEAPMTTWFSACSINRTQGGHLGVLGRAGAARRSELCRVCFPAGMGQSFSDPTELFPDELAAFRTEGETR